MKASFLSALVLVVPALLPATAAEPPSDWRHVQMLTVRQPGLVKISLPFETLGAARPGLEDLRVFDEQDREVPYFMQQAAPAVREWRAAKSLDVTLAPAATVLTLETGVAQPIEAILVDAPTMPFIKAVRIEGSTDGATWQTLADGLPIFRQANGVAQTELALPRGAWPWLRLTMDDRRSDPVPFPKMAIPRLRLAAGESRVEAVPVTIAAYTNADRRSRWVLALPAAHLRLATLQIETAAPLFTRRVTVAAREQTENGVVETPLAGGTMYRVGLEGQPVSSNLTVAVEALVPGRELVLAMEDGDSPPLELSNVRAACRPAYLVFHAERSGAFRLLTGNGQCAAPRYDLAALGANLESVAPSPLVLSPLADNPAYRRPAALPAVTGNGAPLDTAGWRFRKPVTLPRAGAQQLELDLDVLAHAQPGFDDLRLLRGSNQVPFLIERTTVWRTLTPTVTAANDPERPRVSRWRLTLPQAGLPVTRLTGTSPTPLFRRELLLYEEVPDERGSKHRRVLGSASWTQQPDQPAASLSLICAGTPETDTLFLETDNGDNPAIALSKLELSYPATRLAFKSDSTESLHLYYGNARASAPQYDLSLVAGQLAAAEKTAATAGAEERLTKASWREQFGATSGGGPVLWVVLGAVVVALLVVVTKLLPKTSPEPPGDDAGGPAR
ncbi:MAG: DUF3999 family protein [Verrucomicrobiota bacterium]|jgi:hypothetical protein